MEFPRHQRRTASFVLAGALLAGLSGLAACSEETKPEGLPSVRPSVGLSAERTVRPTPTEDETPTRAEEPEPTRTQQARTEDPTREPTRAQEPTPTQEPTRAEEPTAAAASTTAAAVPVSDEDGGGGAGIWGWVLLLLVLTGLAAVLLVSRSRRVTAWDAEARGLAGETRMVIGTHLPPILTTPDAVRRGLVWPPVRDELTSLEARWAAHLEQAPDGERQAYASQVTEMLRDLVIAVDAENEELAAGRDWRRVRPRPDAVIEALNAALAPVPVTGYPVTQPAQPLYPGPEDTGSRPSAPGT